MVYTANWGIIWYLPLIKGTRKLHWFLAPASGTSGKKIFPGSLTVRPWKCVTPKEKEVVFQPIIFQRKTHCQTSGVYLMEKSVVVWQGQKSKPDLYCLAPHFVLSTPPPTTKENTTTQQFRFERLEESGFWLQKYQGYIQFWLCLLIQFPIGSIKPVYFAHIYLIVYRKINRLHRSFDGILWDFQIHLERNYWPTCYMVWLFRSSPRKTSH